jgi:hypothetical protein
MARKSRLKEDCEVYGMGVDRGVEDMQPHLDLLAAELADARAQNERLTIERDAYRGVLVEAMTERLAQQSP